MEKMEKFEFIQTDKRILEQRLRRHQLTQQEYQRLLKALPDDEDRSQEMTVTKKEDPESYSG